WRIEKGINQSTFPEATQSWGKLLEESKQMNKIPDLYRKYLDILSFFILVCPHRANAQIISLLDISY
ncbi:MAG: hypothetical protein AAB116_08350, partial [Candidatus Poribacteria bacterium]